MGADLSLSEQARDSPSTLTKAARVFFSGTLLSRASGTLRDITMAAVFGASPSVAAFMMAYRFAHLLRRVLGEGAFQSAFIPYYEAQRLQDPQQGIHFFRAVSSALALLLLLIISGSGLVLYFLSEWVASSGSREVIFLTLLLLPSLLFICLYGLNAALLQCHRHYFVSSAAPVAFNIIWIAGTLLLWGRSAEEAMPLLAGVVLLACLGQWGATALSVRTVLHAEGFYRESINWKAARLQLAGLATPLLLGIFGVAASQINSAVDALFARYADAQGPAFLWYSIRIQQAPLALFGIALSGALMPPLSRAAKRCDWNHYEQLLSHALTKGLELLTPLTAVLLSCAPAMVQLLYGHGRFDNEAVIGTAACLWGYGFGLLPMGLSLLLAPAFYARGDYRWPSWVAFWCVLANITCNAVLIFGLDFGAASVAWSTSLCAWINAAALAWRLHTRYSYPFAIEREVIFPLLATMMGILLLSLWDIFFWGKIFWFDQMTGVPLVIPSNLLSQISLLTGELIAFGSGYFCFLTCLKGFSRRE